MPETWAKAAGEAASPDGPDRATTGGIDLHLDLSGTRVRAGLETALRGAVQAGRLRPGTRLPSSRALAADLGIARNTVAEVYSQLVAEGWLTAQTGSGTSVAPRPAPGFGAAALGRPEAAVSRYDLRPGVPDLSAFPRRAWLATARKVLAATPDHLLGYPDPRGLPQLRAALAGYLARARGVTADPGRIVICAGFSHGLAVVCRALRSAGAATLAVEAYGHQAHRDIITGQGLGLRPVSVDPMGAVIGEASGADAALLTPAHQFPLGMTLHPRLGCLVVPPRLLDAVTAELAAGPSGLDQLTLAEFITSGGYDRQIRRAQLAYRRRRDRLTTVLSGGGPHGQGQHGQGQHGQGQHVSGIAAGLHAVLDLPRTDLEHDMIARASKRGLALDGLERYRAGPGPVPGGDRAGL